MDLTVSQIAEATWLLSDLLGRRAGSVEQSDNGTFKVVPAGQALETMVNMATGPFPSLSAALAEIERHTRGTCRLDESGSPPQKAEEADAVPETADVIQMRLPYDEV